MQLFIGISRNSQSKSYMLSLTECVWDFQNNALWDTHYHAVLDEPWVNGVSIFFTLLVFATLLRPEKLEYKSKVEKITAPL